MSACFTRTFGKSRVADPPVGWWAITTSYPFSFAIQRSAASTSMPNSARRTFLAGTLIVVSEGISDCFASRRAASKMSWVSIARGSDWDEIRPSASRPADAGQRLFVSRSMRCGGKNHLRYLAQGNRPSGCARADPAGVAFLHGRPGRSRPGGDGRRRDVARPRSELPGNPGSRRRRGGPAPAVRERLRERGTHPSVLAGIETQSGRRRPHPPQRRRWLTWLVRSRKAAWSSRSGRRKRIPFPFSGSKEMVSRGPVHGGRGRLSHDPGSAGRPNRLRVRPDGKRTVGTGDLPRPRRGGAEGDASLPEVQGGLRSQRVPDLAYRTGTVGSARHDLRGRRARGLVPQRRPRGHVARFGFVELSSDEEGVATRWRGAVPPHRARRPAEREASHRGNQCRRSVRDAGWRTQLDDGEPRRAGRVPPEQVPGVGPVRAQARLGRLRGRLPLPAESLWDLPSRTGRWRMDGSHERPAVRFRISNRRASKAEAHRVRGAVGRRWEPRVPERADGRLEDDEQGQSVATFHEGFARPGRLPWGSPGRNGRR